MWRQGITRTLGEILIIKCPGNIVTHEGFMGNNIYIYTALMRALWEILYIYTALMRALWEISTHEGFRGNIIHTALMMALWEILYIYCTREGLMGNILYILHS